MKQLNHLLDERQLNILIAASIRIVSTAEYLTFWIVPTYGARYRWNALIQGYEFESRILSA